MLALIARHSPIIMPLCAVLGFCVPALAEATLRWLPEILFFMMFFALLGINQKQLILLLTRPAIWRFALLQTVGFCLFCSAGAYILGVRGDLLLALAAISATAPLFGSAVVVNAVGFDPMKAMAQTIAATLLMPLPLLLILKLLSTAGAELNLALYFQRLLIYISTPIVLAVVLRRLIPGDVLTRYYPSVARFNVLLLMCFPIGLISGFRRLFDHNPLQAAWMLGLGVLLVAVFYFGTYLLYRKQGEADAIPAALVSGGRNLMLSYIITTPFTGPLFLPLVGAVQLPIFSLAFIGKLMARRHFAAQAANPSATEPPSAPPRH